MKKNRIPRNAIPKTQMMKKLLLLVSTMALRIAQIYGHNLV